MIHFTRKVLSLIKVNHLVISWQREESWIEEHRDDQPAVVGVVADGRRSPDFVNDEVGGAEFTGELR